MFQPNDRDSGRLVHELVTFRNGRLHPRRTFWRLSYGSQWSSASPKEIKTTHLPHRALPQLISQLPDADHDELICTLGSDQFDGALQLLHFSLR